MGLEYDLGSLPTLSETIGSHIRMRYNGMLERLSLYPMIKPKPKPKPKPIIVNGIWFKFILIKGFERLDINIGFII